jgi:hypothetical protein
MAFTSGVQKGVGGGVSGGKRRWEKFLMGMVMADRNTTPPIYSPGIRDQHVQ